MKTMLTRQSVRSLRAYLPPPQEGFLPPEETLAATGVKGSDWRAADPGGMMTSGATTSTTTAVEQAAVDLAAWTVIWPKSCATSPSSLDPFVVCNLWSVWSIIPEGLCGPSESTPSK